MSQVTSTNGVTLLICTYNGGRFMEKNLGAIKSQQGVEHIPWEVIVVDNASKDDTSDIVRRVWDKCEIQFKLLYEEKPGKDNALRTGFNEARYSTVCIIDDDTVMCKTYVSKVFEIMNREHNVGIIGGHGIGDFEVPPPAWLKRFENALALGPQARKAGIMEPDEIYVYGACSAVRKSLWEHLHNNGFKFWLSGRTGKSKISSGEDAELALAACLSGYRIWYEPELRFHHYMPANRLTWEYFRRLFRSFGRSDMITNLYQVYSGALPKRKTLIYNNYLSSIVYDLYFIIKKLPAYIWALLFRNEGNKAILEFERNGSHFLKLFTSRKVYVDFKKTMDYAAWTTINGIKSQSKLRSQVSQQAVRNLTSSSRPPERHAKED